MLFSRNFSLTSIIILISIQNSLEQNCGVERWSIKTLSDADTVLINFQEVIPSTVHEQVLLERPPIRNSRLQSETVVYSITCFLIGYKAESNDKDIHVIIEDINTDETMVVEIPSYECFEIMKTSREQLFTELYNWFNKNIGYPVSNFTFLQEHIPLEITGVGFFDSNHGQKGMADNGREIHPVLSIKVLDLIDDIFHANQILAVGLFAADEKQIEVFAYDCEIHVSVSIKMN